MSEGMNDNVPEPPFELMDLYGRVKLIYLAPEGRRTIDLGTDQEAGEIMANFLGQIDFGERPWDRPADEFDEY